MKFVNLRNAARALNREGCKQIIKILETEGTLMVTDICERIPYISRARVSQHLAELHTSRIVNAEYEGKHRYFQINKAVIDVLRNAEEIVTEHIRDYNQIS